MQNLLETSDSGNNRQSAPSPDSKNSGITIADLFVGCTDKESLKTRYHALMKTYHTDNPNGDKDMAQRIQTEYEKLLKNFT